MRKGYLKACAISVAMMLFLTGCGMNYPELTAEEEVMVGEYAAKLLLKYDANNRSRLIVREELDEEEVVVEEPEDLQEETQEEVLEEPEVSLGEPEVVEPSIEYNEAPPSNMIASPEEFYELSEGISIDYLGMELCSSYPPAGQADSYFALDATEGKTLMVLKFKIENHAQSDQKVDLLTQNVLFRITANGGYTRNTLTTMLLDDMSTYVGTLGAGEAQEVVLLAEVDDNVANSISTLMLNLKNDAKTCTIQLQ